VLATADLHFRLYPEGDAATVQLARHVCDSDADILLVAGDVADLELSNFGECLSLFEGFGGAKLLVPGNHDLWTKASDTEKVYRSVLPRMAEENNFAFLDHRPVVRGRTGFIGNIGWYDYSFRNPELGLSQEDYENKRIPGVCTWNDRNFIRWDYTDHQFTDRCVRRLREQYREVEDRCEQVICVLHHLPFSQLLYGPADAPLEFCRAYLGSERFGRLLLRMEKVKWCVCGHRHGPASHRANGLLSLVVGSEYKKKRLLEIDLADGSNFYRDFSAETAR
jgi:predicted phosphohydrolase